MLLGRLFFLSEMISTYLASSLFRITPSTALAVRNSDWLDGFRRITCVRMNVLVISTSVIATEWGTRSVA